MRAQQADNLDDQRWISLIADEVQKAVLHACKKTYEKMCEAKVEMNDAVITGGAKLLSCESAFLSASKTGQFVKGAALKTTVGEISEQEGAQVEGDADVDDDEVLQYMKSLPEVSLASMERRLLETMAEFEEAKLRTREGEAQDAMKYDGATAPQQEKEQWRLMVDSEIKFLEDANREQLNLINENKRLRAALSFNPSAEAMEDILIQRDLELAKLSQEIAQAQLTHSSLRAEMKELSESGAKEADA